MKTGAPRLFRRSIVLATAGILAMMLTACTGNSGRSPPPNELAGSYGEASFGFTFSCEDKGGINPPTGQLRLQLTYTDLGGNPIGSSFSIQGTADELDPDNWSHGHAVARLVTEHPQLRAWPDDNPDLAHQLDHRD